MDSSPGNSDIAPTCILKNIMGGAEAELSQGPYLPKPNAHQKGQQGSPILADDTFGERSEDRLTTDRCPIKEDR